MGVMTIEYRTQMKPVAISAERAHKSERSVSAMRNQRIGKEEVRYRGSS